MRNVAATAWLEFVNNGPGSISGIVDGNMTSPQNVVGGIAVNIGPKINNNVFVDDVSSIYHFVLGNTNNFGEIRLSANKTTVEGTAGEVYLKGTDSSGTAVNSLSIDATGKVIRTPPSSGSFALTDGNATTADGTAVDLGGTLTNDLTIDGPHSIIMGLSIPLSTFRINAATTIFDQDIELQGVVTLSGTMASNNAGDSMLVINTANNEVGYRAIPSGSSGVSQSALDDTAAAIRATIPVPTDLHLDSLNFTKQVDTVRATTGVLSGGIVYGGVVRDTATANAILDANGAMTLSGVLTVNNDATVNGGFVVTGAGEFDNGATVFNTLTNRSVLSLTQTITDASVTATPGYIFTLIGGGNDRTITNSTDVEGDIIQFINNGTSLPSARDYEFSESVFLPDGITSFVQLENQTTYTILFANGKWNLISSQPAGQINSTITKALLIGETGTSTPIDYAITSGQYMVSVNSNITAISAGTLIITVNYRDEAGSLTTFTYPTVSTVTHSNPQPIMINTDGSRNISVVATFAGVSITYNVGATVQKL